MKEDDASNRDSRRNFIAVAGATAATAVTGDAITKEAPHSTSRNAEVWAVQRVFSQYGRCLDDHRFDDMGVLFAQDAVLHIAAFGIVEKGRDAIVSRYKQFTGGLHAIFNHMIDIDNNTAAATADFMFVDIATIPRIAIIGRYLGRLESNGPGWRILEWNIEVRANASSADQK